MLVEDLAKVSRSSRNAAFGAMIVIAAFGLYNWIAAPHTAYLFAAQRYESLVGNIAKKNEVISKVVDTKKKKLYELRKLFANLKNTLFTTKEAKEFFSDLQVISEQAGCSVYSLTFDTTEVKIGGKKSDKTAGIIA